MKTVHGNFVRFAIAAIPAAILFLATLGVGISWGMALAEPRLGSSPAAVEAVQPLTGPTSVVTASPAPPASKLPSFSAPSTPQAGDSEVDLALVEESVQLLRQQFYGEVPSGRELTYAILRGLTDQLGDEHTAFLDPQEADLLEAEMEGQFEGIGARVGEAEGGGAEITYLFPAQPAESAGLLVGDVIVGVDGSDVTEEALGDIISRIRGPHGSAVTLTVRRGTDPLFDLRIVRAQIEFPIVETNTLADGKVAYVALHEFSSLAPARLASALRSAISEDPVGVVLDLRGNPGGLLDSAVSIGSYFVPDGSILLERFRDGTERVYERKGPYLLSGLPLVVLVDEGSASASEIVAGAIQDADQGVLVGTTTFGKGSVQLPNTLSDGSQLRITIARWFTPLGRGIHDVGLEPDVQVEITDEDRRLQRDPQLERAIDLLLGGSTARDLAAPGPLL